jgi:hypothetical protein
MASSSMLIMIDIHFYELFTAPDRFHRQKITCLVCSIYTKILTTRTCIIVYLTYHLVESVISRKSDVNSVHFCLLGCLVEQKKKQEITKNLCLTPFCACYVPKIILMSFIPAMIILLPL